MNIIKIILTFVLTALQGLNIQHSIKNDKCQKNIGVLEINIPTADIDIENNIDSIVIFYCNDVISFDVHHLRIFPNRVVFDDSINVTDVLFIEKLNEFINIFYIAKSEKIILSTNDEPDPISDYPFIRIDIYSGEKKYTNITSIYRTPEYNPKFIEFFDFICDLNRNE